MNFDPFLEAVKSHMQPEGRAQHQVGMLQQLLIGLPDDVRLSDLVAGWQLLARLLVGLMALGGMLAGLLLLSASRPLVATLVAVIASFALATLITQVAKYKISLHIDSAAGAVTVCCLLASPVFLVLSPLVVLIAWARWKLEAHPPASGNLWGSPRRDRDGHHVLALWPPLMIPLRNVQRNGQKPEFHP